MQSFTAPLLVTDENGEIGTIVGPQIVGGGGNPAGVLQAGALLLYGAPGVDAGPQRLSLFGEPGIVDLTGDDNTRLRLEAGGRLSIADSNENTRVAMDATGNITVSDESGTFSVVISAGAISLINTSPGFESNILLEAAGRISLSDAVGNTASYSAAGWTVNGEGGCTINGGNLTVTGDIFLPGADCAEEFDVAAGHTLEPGTVVVIDSKGALAECKKAYDHRVAGVVSGAGEHRPGIILDRQGVADGRAPVALIGKVACKVTAAGGPIAIGDLLTTSALPGHAMRAQDHAQAFGAVLGKAMQALPSGTGLITILVTMQ